MSGVEANDETAQGEGRGLRVCRYQGYQEADTDDHPDKQSSEQCALPCLQCAENGKEGTKADAGPQSKSSCMKEQPDQSAEECAERQNEQSL